MVQAFEDTSGAGGGPLTPEEEEERKRRLWAAILAADAARKADAEAARAADPNLGAPVRDRLTPIGPEPAAVRAADPNLAPPPRDVLPDTPGFVPGPDEGVVIDYEDEPFIPVTEAPARDFEEEPFTREALLGAFPEEFLDTEGEQPLAPDVEDEPFTLPPPPDELVLPDVEEVLSAPPVPEDYFLDREAEEQPPAPDVAALTDGVSFLTLAEEERRRRTEEARLEGLDLLAGFEPDSLRAQGARDLVDADKLSEYLPPEETDGFRGGLAGIPRGRGVPPPSRPIGATDAPAPGTVMAGLQRYMQGYGGAAAREQERRFIESMRPEDRERYNNQSRSAEDQAYINRLRADFLVVEAGRMAAREGIESLVVPGAEASRRPDFLFLPEGTGEAETGTFDFTLREGPTVATGLGAAEPLPPGAEAGGGLAGGGEAFPSTGGPELTVDRLAQLPDLSQFGFADLPELPGLAALQGPAADLVAARDQPELTPASFRDLVLAEAGRTQPDATPALIDAWLTSPDGQAAFEQVRAGQAADRGLAQTEIDRINQGLAVEAARERSIARLQDAQAGTRATAAIDIGATEPLTLTGRVSGGVFTPDDPVKITEAEEEEFIQRLADQGITVHEIVQPRDENIVQAAATRIVPNVISQVTRGAGLPVIAVAETVNTMLSGSTTVVEQAMRPYVWAQDRTQEGFMQGTLRLQSLPVFSEAEQELAAVMRSLPRTRQNAIMDAWYGATFFDPKARRDLATDIKNGMSDDDLNQKYSSFWKELAVDFVVDPANLAVPIANTVRALRGLERASGVINLRGRQMNQGAAEAVRHVSDAEAVAPWQRVTRFGDPRVLVRRAPGQQRRDILGTATQSARGSSATILSREIAGLMEAKAAEDLSQLEPIFRSLATQGGDATARQYFQGIGATRVLQDGTYVAPDVVTAFDTPGSALRVAYDKPVYSGPGSYFSLPAKEQAKFYASDLEKLKDVTDELQTALKQSARRGFGLDPERDSALVRSQQAMRGVLSRLYLSNIRYYLRNFLGDMVTAWSLGTSVFSKKPAREAFLVGVLNDTTTRVPGRVSGEAGAVAGLKGLFRRLGNLENDRGRSAYFNADVPFWNARRAATPDDGFDLIRDLSNARDIRNTVRSATQPGEIRAMAPTSRGTLQGFKLTQATVLDDLDDFSTMPGLRSTLDGLAGRAARGETVTPDIGRHLRSTAAHATEAGAHFNGRAVTVDDWRRLAGEVDQLVAGGMPYPEARARVLATFADEHMADIRAAGIRQEITERISKGPYAARFRDEWRALQSRYPPLGARTLAEGSITPEARTAMDALLVKIRTAQNGLTAGGPNGVKRIRSFDDLVTLARQNVEQARAKLAAIEAEPIPTRPAGRQRITVTHDTPAWRQFREADRIDRRAEAARQTRITAQRDVVRDTEDALANLEGRGGTNGLGDQSTATAATAAAVQSAKDALTILAFESRLPGAVQEFQAAGAAAGTLTRIQRENLLQYLEHQEGQLFRDKIATRKAGEDLADFGLHNYERTYDYDWYLRWIAPWELWTSRSLAKLPLRMIDHPAYFSKVALLRENMQDANADLPEWLRERVKIPIPWAPDFLGDTYFFDPVKLFLPTDMLDTFVRESELETKQGRARAVMGFMGQNPGPIADMLMALAPGGMGWWETQERNPVVSVWSGIVPAINKITGANIPINPIYQEKHYKAATRILFQKSVSEGWDEERYRAAIEDLRRNETTGVRLRAPGLANEDAARALQEAQTRYTLPSLMSLFGLVGTSFTRQWEDDAFDLSEQYFTTRKEQGPEAAKALLEQNPDLQRWWLTGEGKTEALREVANARYFADIERASTTYRESLDKLPLRGTDKDRQQLREQRDREIMASAALLKEEYPDWQPPERPPNLVQGIAGALLSQPVVRDSNGVLDWEATVEQRNGYLKALEQAPRTEGDQILMELAPANLRPQVEAAMRPQTPDGALNQVIDGLISQGWEDRAKAGAGAATIEDKQQAEAEFEANWKLPDRDTLVRLAAEAYPELFRQGGRYTGADLYAALDGAIASTLAEASTASSEQRRQKFFANLDPETGVSSEPFYANKAAGVLIRTEADYQRMEKGRADDREYDARKAANDPTYRLFDTDDRAWVQGGEPIVALNSLSRAIIEHAVGPVLPNGNNDPSKAQGWNEPFRFPDGTKMRPYDALQLVNQQISDYYAGIYGERLPSEKDDEAKEQTANSNAAARGASRAGGGAARGGRSADRPSSRRASSSRGAGRSYRSSSYRAPRTDPLGPSPSVPSLKWINDGVLTRTRLTSVDTEGNLTVALREEWRKGTGLTPEKWAAFLQKHPDVDAAISQAEALHAGIAADPNGVTAAIHEQALVVQTALETARATDAERRAGIQVSGLTNITEQMVDSKRIRKGEADVARAFRTGTAGLGTPAKWDEFIAKHPELGQAIAQAQAQVDALTTEDEAPDDLTQLQAVYEALRVIGDQITTARDADRDAERERLTALKEAGAQLREEQRDEMRALQAGAVVPSIDNINDAWLQPDRLRRGGTDFDRAFRLGSGSGLADPAAWTAFLQRNPQLAAAIGGLQEQAGAFVTKAVAPRDAEAMTAFYDQVAQVAAQITAAEEAEAEAERQTERVTRRTERIEDSDIIRGEPGIGFFTARRAARRKKRRDEEEEE